MIFKNFYGIERKNICFFFIQGGAMMHEKKNEISFRDIELKEYKTILHYKKVNKDILKKEIKKHIVYTNKLPIHEIDVSEHAWKRWNERVGPSIGQEQLKKMLCTLIIELNRIEFINHQFALIDDEIVIIYEKDKKSNSISIVTFYGRISVLPFLMNIEALRKFNLKNDELINLKVSSKILIEQNPPQIPKQIVRFKERRNFFQIEHYIDEANQDILYMFKIDSTGKCNIQEIDIHIPNQILNKKVVKMLKMMGFVEFVNEHKKFIQTRYDSH